jgi:hypothetical protein
VPELCAVEHDDQSRDQAVIEVSDHVPGERPRWLMELVGGPSGCARPVTSEAVGQGRIEGTDHYTVLRGQWTAVASLITPPESYRTPRVVLRPVA